MVLAVNRQAHPVVEILCLNLLEDAESLITFQRVDHPRPCMEVRLHYLVFPFDEDSEHPKENNVEKRNANACGKYDLVRQYWDVSYRVEVAPIVEGVDLDQRVDI